jgi:hypothetical protein
MASLALMVGGAIVNALAFSGSNYLFSSLGKGERERHDKAVEELQSAQIKWSRKRTQRIDWINEELRRQGHALSNFQDVDAAMREYYLVTKKVLPPMEPEPKLYNFYVPSEAQKDREIAFIILGMGAVFGIAYKLL